jgi:hypothetical protein
LCSMRSVEHSITADKDANALYVAIHLFLIPQFP